ncbi:MAG: GTPase HflX [Gemmatimonadetes bacterium]|nr:GTPase HflX [Gemmatimonadota bacterium]
MIEIQPPLDRAILVSAPVRGSYDEHHAHEHLDELERLTDTAGADVVGRVTQRIAKMSPKALIGPGKLVELTELVTAKDATLVIFDHELTPAQGKNLEHALDVRVMDRTELILDIFATRARTNEAKMQVELAQLKYLLPRLARMWTHLSRIRGGIGLRGPGETQIETDRRLIRRRISKLKNKLGDVERHRGVVRQGQRRRGVLRAALVGYTNAGKSSLLRAFSGADVLVENRLFATLDTVAREVFVPPAGKIRLIDTVGFIRKLPHDLVASFKATLEEATHADVLLHVIDASHPDWEEQVAVVDRALADLDLNGPRVVHVFNKMDRVCDRAAFESRARHQYEEAVFVAVTAPAIDELKRKFAALVNGTVARATRAAG